MSTEYLKAKDTFTQRRTEDNKGFEEYPLIVYPLSVVRTDVFNNLILQDIGEFVRENIANVPSSSWALQALSASHATTADTASYISSSATFDFTPYNLTASWALNSISSSFATTASFSIISFTTQSTNFQSSASWASSSLTASFLLYKGFFNGSASYAISSSYASYAEFANQANNAYTAAFAQALTFIPIYSISSSWASSSISASYALSASNLINPPSGAATQFTAAWAQNSTNATHATTADYSTYALSASWASQSISSSYAKSASYSLTSSFSTSASYSLTSSYSVTSSFTTTASYAISSSNSVSASYAISASNSISSSYAITASYADTAKTAAFAMNGGTSAIGSLQLPIQSARLSGSITPAFLNAGVLNWELIFGKGSCSFWQFVLPQDYDATKTTYNIITSYPIVNQVSGAQSYWNFYFYCVDPRIPVIINTYNPDVKIPITMSNDNQGAYEMSASKFSFNAYNSHYPFIASNLIIYKIERIDDVDTPNTVPDGIAIVGNVFGWNN